MPDNVDNAFGFLPYGPVLRTQPYKKDSSAAVVYFGDVVMMENDGNIAPATAGNTELLGSAADYSAGSTEDGSVGVHDHPDQQYIAQDDGSGVPAQTYVGNNADHVATTGVAALYRSRHEIDLSSVGTSDGGFRLLGFLNRPDNAVGNGDYVIWRCQVNTAEHHLAKQAGV